MKATARREVEAARMKAERDEKSAEF